MAKSTNYLKSLNDVLKEVSEKHEISIEDLKDLLDHFFKTFKYFIEDPRMPTIKITNLGTFKPNLSKINYHIRRQILRFKKSGGNADRLKIKIKKLWPIRDRLIAESKGKITWLEWRNKKLDN